MERNQTYERSEQKARVLETMAVEAVNLTLTRARGIQEAMKLLDQHNIDLVLSDYRLSDGDGLGLLEALAEKEMKTPVVILTAYGDEMIASELIQAGAYDYLTKDRLSKESLARSITKAVEKGRLRREIQMAQAKMAEMATRDELTGLYNRRYFEAALEREIANARRHERELVLCMIDLDHFKQVNDTYGHAAGDSVLSEIGKMLKQWARQSDLPSRYGGEEFAVILPDTSLEGGRIACERLRETAVAHRFEYGESLLQITVSIGIAQYDGSTDQSPSELIRKADQVLYDAKEGGRNRVVGLTIED